jgi:squalene-hopene/tetraprenyl-beta-curcumene cyclase
MLGRAAVCCSLWLFSLAPAVAGDWSPRLAAQYLDNRQKEWFDWPTANANAKPCISCHTGMTYLLARPALRGALGEASPTTYETGLLASLRSRVDKRDPPAGPGLGVETVFAARFLNSPEAMDRFWALQIKDGAGKGAWNWFSLELDPWEVPDSRFYGAALAAMSIRPADQGRPEARELVAYLHRELASQPLHNRLMLLWASTRFPQVLDAADRRAIVEQVWKAQQRDGSWTNEAMGPFATHAAAPDGKGSNAYMTAFATYVMRQAADDPGNPKLKRAMDWLRNHQDPMSGAWQAVSMNKEFPAGSQQAKFMSDAATGFAVLALLGPSTP